MSKQRTDGSKNTINDNTGAPKIVDRETFQAELFEQASIVDDGESPFGVVIGEKLGRRAAPFAARLAVGAFEHRAHVSFMSSLATSGL